MPEHDRDGLLIIIAAPSGTGKSTIAKALFERMPRLAFSVSHTTRPPRPGEVDGQHYHFVSDATFAAMIDDDAFAEWARVHDRHYGTSKGEVARLGDAGKDILFDVDVQGAELLLAAYPDAVSIFVVPPSLEELERRLRGRGTESPDQLATRLANARRELSCADQFSYVVVNSDLRVAIDAVQTVIEAEGHRRLRNPRLASYVRDMASDP